VLASALQFRAWPHALLARTFACGQALMEGLAANKLTRIGMAQTYMNFEAGKIHEKTLRRSTGRLIFQKTTSDTI
jgi:hypothetical protein